MNEFNKYMLNGILSGFIIYLILWGLRLVGRKKEEKKIFNQKVDEFKNWAFGEDFHLVEGCDYVARWNERRGNLLWIKATGDLETDFKPMINIWKMVR